MELSHKFLLIALQVWSKVGGNPIRLRDVFQIGDALILWCVDEFWYITIRLIGHRFIGWVRCRLVYTIIGTYIHGDSVKILTDLGER